MKQANLLTENCPSGSVDVCFEKNNCEINVDVNDKSVEKGNEIVYFEDSALMYGAIFSNKEVYECQVQRLMKRLGELSLVYDEKESIISQRGCSSDVNLLSLANSASSLEDSSDLYIVKNFADDVEGENERAYCELW